MNKIKVDIQERELLAASEKDNSESELTEQRARELAGYANHTLDMERQLQIKISNRDLELLQRRALKEGLSHQALISSVIHKYLYGGLKDVS